MKSNSNSILERIAKLKAQRNQVLKELINVPPEQKETISESIPQKLEDEIQEAIILKEESKKNLKIPNAKQQEAIDLAFQGKSFCLCGSAGTGKTFTTEGITEKLLNSSHTKPIGFSTKYLSAGKPAIVLTAFTKRATKNAEEAIQNSKITCINFHKLIQFEPRYYDVEDKDGNIIKTRRFEPKYNKNNKLPHISTILIEEASQFSIQFYEQLIEALPNPSATQFIFIGDIQQIPPTMGMSIYGPKLIELPGIELTEVYRQALESPIIRLLTDIRNGKDISRLDWKSYSYLPNGERNGQMNFGVFPPNLDWEGALYQTVGFLRQEFESGNYNPYSDMVLVPFNVKFGTENLNKEIAHFLDKKESRLIHPIICGWARKYLAVGDYILFNTEDYVIKEIRPNPKYNGIDPDPASKFIDREGSVWDRKSYTKEQSDKAKVHDLDLSVSESDEIENEKVRSPLELEQFISAQLAQNDQDEKFNQASHILILESLDDPSSPLTEVESTGDIAKIILSYAITVHKAQGLQAKKVYFFLHNSHSPMHFRELIYTAASRAKEILTIICDPKFLQKGLQKQRIPGHNLEEKKQHFIRLLTEKEPETNDEGE